MAELILQRTYYYPGTLALRLVNSIIGVIEAGLMLRLVLELFGADSASPFVALVYDVTGRLLRPFSNAFPDFSLGGSSVVDSTAILGMIVYAVIGLVIIRLLALIFSTVNMP